MTPYPFSPQLWLRDLNHPAIGLQKWQQQLNLINHLFHAQTCLIVQVYQDECQVVCQHPHALMMFDTEQITPFSKLLTQLGQSGFPAQVTEDKILAYAIGDNGLLSLDLYWPDGSRFGHIFICGAPAHPKMNTLLTVIEPIKALIQAELKNFYLMKQIETLSLQDELTGMLNPYGFSMMAPRQLSLSRRFGSHAGIVIVELCETPVASHSQDDRQAQLRLLARIINDNLRVADVPARLNDSQFILLAFIDSQANLSTLVSRLIKQIARHAPELRVALGQCFFTPDETVALEAMEVAAHDDLLKDKARLYPHLS